ncbi:ribonuclease H [Senna tora]|uniref:Ribonuclease H n=1 Tax=Senna tora TaxID=362788 RepID=A0A834T9V6_9FABA|nr:ribonuclease H [Senna tora]
MQSFIRSTTAKLLNIWRRAKHHCITSNLIIFVLGIRVRPLSSYPWTIGWLGFLLIRILIQSFSREWRTSFAEASVKVLTRIYSDHHPILINLEDECGNARNRPFRFEDCWTQHAEFKPFIQAEWNNELDPHMMLNSLSSKLSEWNRTVFGDIKQKKNNLLKRIHGIQKNEDGDWTEDVEEIKAMAVNYFRKLFEEDNLIRCHVNFNAIWPPIPCTVWDMVNTPFTDDEVKKAVFSIGGLKAPGSDGFPAKRTQEIGRYLGANIYHGRWAKHNFNHLVEKIQSRLAGWKSNCLAMAGRATLIQSVISTMPLFHMQNNVIPKGIIKTIEKHERAFLWGSTPEKKRMHQISWDTICTPKEAGGLGIRSLEGMNKAFIYKLAWSLLCDQDSLWVKVLKDKYGFNCNNTFSVSSKNSDSRLWKEITRVWDDFADLVGWEVGNGEKIKFWWDKWIPGQHRLIEDTTCDIEQNEFHKGLNKFTNDNGCWNIDMFKDCLPFERVDAILKMNPPDAALGPDQPRWEPSENNAFTIRSAYHAIQKCNMNNNEQNWKRIWKSRNAYRNQFLLWRLSHEKLPTKSRISSWSGSNPTCVLCRNANETNLHMIRDCPCVAPIWKYFIKPSDRALFFCLPMKDWISWNLKKKFCFIDIPWEIIFSTACSFIWEWRNKLINNEDFRYPTSPHSSIITAARAQNKALGNPLSRVDVDPHCEKALWKVPERGWIKVNIDGAVCRRNMVAGCGGLFRNDDGKWLHGFTCNLGNVVAQCTDSMVGLLNPHPTLSCIKKLMSKEWEVKIKLIPRNINTCADRLAKEGLKSSQNCSLLDGAPTFLQNELASEALSAFLPDLRGS